MKYYDYYCSKNGGFDLYYYDTTSKDFDNFQGNFSTIELAKLKARKDGYEKKPIYFRD